MSNNALPENLRGKRHSDWIWPLCYIKRKYTAFKWKMPPALLIGYNVRTWNTEQGKDVLTYEYPFSRGWLFMKWRPELLRHIYGPNAIQKILGTWCVSFHVTWPLGVQLTIKLWRYKEPTKQEPARGYDGVRVIYFRFGARWDSYDLYYNLGFFFGLTYN